VGTVATVMLTAGALTLFGLAALDWLMKKDILAPSVLFCGMWALTLFALALSGSWYYPVNPVAVAIYVYGGLAFCIGSWATSALVQLLTRYHVTSVEETASGRSQLMRVGLLVALELVLLVPYVRGQLLIVSGASWRVALQVIRIHSLMMQVEGPASTMSPVANAPVVALAAAVAAWYIRGTKPLGRILAGVAVGGAVVVNVLTGAKIGVVTLIVVLAAMSGLQSRGQSLRKLAVGVVVGLTVFAMGTLLINYAFVPVTGVGGTVRLAGLTTLDYWLGGPVAFSNVVAKPQFSNVVVQPQAFESTQPLMTFFLNTARSLGFRSTSPAQHASYSAIGPGRDTNVYTIYFTYFKDHGWLGMIGLCALLAAVLTLLWRSSRRGATLPVLFYALCVPSLLLSVFAESFWTGLNQWIKLLILLSLVFIPWKLKARRGASVHRMT